ncbi:MAG: SDR family oxidoreductase [Deltaproteobacteria bacterium]|nr:SDR family oxidoreductase [Deltaproteobacteria bacterium]
MEQKYGKVSIVIQADVSVSSEFRAAVAQVYERWGKINIFLNNAGIVSVSKLEHISEEEWDH